MKITPDAFQIEYEIGDDGERTGRIRTAQFYRTMRWQTVPPEKRIAMPFGEWTEDEARYEALKRWP